MLKDGGAPLAIAPRLEALAERSIVCTAAWTTAPMTLPSHASVFTGLYPFSHGVRDNDAFRLQDGATTMAGELLQAGYRTEAFVAATVLHAGTGLDQGFEQYHDLEFRRARNLAKEVERRADAVTDQVLSRLGVDDSRPWFFWVHYFDPHHPYAAPGADPGAPRREAYEAEVAYLDEQLGRLLDALDDTGLRENTAITVVGDHGEGLLLEDELTHGFLLEEGTLRVPLLVQVPGAASHGRLTTPCSIVDVYPTLLTLAGVAPSSPVHGRDLVQALQAPDPERAVYFEALHGYHVLRWAPLRGLASARHRYVQGSREVVRDLADGALHPEAAPLFRQRLEELLARPVASFETTAVEATAAEQARLRSLGYLTVTSSESLPEAESLPDPRDAYRQYLQYEQGLGLAQEGRAADAIVLMEPMVAAHPDNPTFHDRLGRVYLAAGRMTDGIAELEHALELDPELISALYYLGRAYLMQNDLPRAEARLAAAVALFPGHYEALVQLRDVYLRRGRLDELLVTCVRLAAACDEIDDATTRNMRDGTLAALPEIVSRVRDGDRGAETLTRCRTLLEAMTGPSRQRLEALLAE